MRYVHLKIICYSFLLHKELKMISKYIKQPSRASIFFKFSIPIVDIRAYVFTKFGATLSKFKQVMHDNITKIVHDLLSHLPDKPLKLWS